MTTLVISATQGVRDRGSVILLEGVEPKSGGVFWFAADRRPALAIIEALQSGYEDEIVVDVEPWQIFGGPR